MTDERVLDVLYAAGPQSGERKPEDIVAALEAAGYVIVPREPTPDMVDAACVGMWGKAHAPQPAYHSSEAGDWVWWEGFSEEKKAGARRMMSRALSVLLTAPAGPARA